MLWCCSLFCCEFVRKWNTLHRISPNRACFKLNGHSKTAKFLAHDEPRERAAAKFASLCAPRILFPIFEDSPNLAANFEPSSCSRTLFDHLLQPSGFPKSRVPRFFCDASKYNDLPTFSQFGQLKKQNICLQSSLTFRDWKLTILL